MHEIKLRMQSCRRRGVSRERHTWSVAIGRRGVKIMWGVTAGKASHNTSNARAVTAGKMGRNSSNNNGRKCSCLSWLAGYLIEERRRWLIIIASPRGQILCSK